MKIGKTFTVEAPQEQVWAFITHPDRIAPCIPGCERAEETEPGKYEAAIRVKVGPIKTTFEVEIREIEEEAPEYAVYETKGEEGGRASRVKATSTLKLKPVSDSTTEVTYDSDIKIIGRLGKFGSGMMQKVADGIGDEFVVELKNRLEGKEATEAEVEAGRELEIGKNWLWWAVGIGAVIVAAALAWYLL